MIHTRRGRLEELKQKKRLGLAIVGSISLLIFLAAFGFKIFVGFSLLVEMLRGTPAQPAQQAQKRIFPPVVDPLPIATRSGALRISGTGEPNLTAIIYVDNAEAKKTVVAGNGNFFVSLTPLKDGEHTIQVKLTDNRGNSGNPSELTKIMIKSTPPILEVTAPEDNSTVNGDRNVVKVEGKTEEDSSVSINGRLVVVRTDNSFTYDYPLSEGDNTLTIEARDVAGNITKTERTVIYHK